jgi:hypothetical protein
MRFASYVEMRLRLFLFSDHGMNLEENRRVDLRTHLSRHNFTVANQLKGSAPCGVDTGVWIV